MSPSDHDESTLPEGVESLLVDWPVREDPAFEDRNAEAVQARLEEVEAGSTPDALLAPPLPATDEDGSLDAATAKAPVNETPPQSRPAPESAPPRSLADLARAAVAESDKPRNDLTDIARESLSVASQSRPSAPDIAAALAARPSRPPASTPPPASSPPPPSSATPAPRRGNGPLIAAGVALLGLAAGLVLYVHSENQPAPLATNANVQLPKSVAAAAAPPPAASAAAPQAKTDDEKGVLTLDQLPNGKLAAADKPASPTGAPHVHLLAAPRKGEAPTPGKKEAKAAPTAQQPQKRAPTDQPLPGMKPAEGTTSGGVPDKPTTGQVAVAVGAVLGSARACVAGQEQPSRAVIVFGSNGRVKSVSVSGPAAGTPAAGCIRAALSQARVQPFARSHFSVATPVRPQ